MGLITPVFMERLAARNGPERRKTVVMVAFRTPCEVVGDLIH